MSLKTTLETLKGYFTGGSANDSLKLGNIPAAEYAKKTDITDAIAAAGSGDVISTETSTTAGHIIGFADTLGKKIKSLAVAIGNASGNIPLSNGALNVNLNAQMLGGVTLDQKWKFLPIGFEYVQRKGQSAPASLFGGGTWSNVSSEYAGHFERVEGGNAVGFGGTQRDAIRNISGSFPTYDRHNRSPVGAFKYGSRWSAYLEGAGADSWGVDILFDASGQVPTAADNRPVNYTVRIWRLVAY